MKEYPFFTDTRVRLCRCTRCVYHDTKSAISEGYSTCTLKVTEMNNEGECESKILLPKPTVGDIKEYFKEKGVKIKE